MDGDDEDEEDEGEQADDEKNQNEEKEEDGENKDDEEPENPEVLPQISDDSDNERPRNEDDEYVFITLNYLQAIPLYLSLNYITYHLLGSPLISTMLLENKLYLILQVIKNKFQSTLELVLIFYLNKIRFFPQL